MTETFNSSDYSTYKEKEFSYRWLRHEHLTKQLDKYRKSPNLRFYEFAQSEEGRSINRIEYGDGPIKVMLWSQMHGNESTATMALMDLLAFLTTNGDLYDNLRKQIAQKLTLQFIPMLNPDGAERFTRRNALNIDMNRDARSLQTLEMKSFVDLFKSFKPHWAFNLHDQRNFFSAGDSEYPATISFLSASAEITRKLTTTREKSMKLVSVLADIVEDLLPGHCGRYTDEFYPRALGEFCHQQEVPCVLIESGTYLNDPNRDVARKFNFLILMEAFENLMDEGFLDYDTRAYHSIPENGKNILDLVIRACTIETSGSKVDLGFMIKEIPNLTTFELEKELILTDLGDLSFQYGLEEEEGGYIENVNTLVLEKPANLKVTREKDIFEMKNGKKL